VVMLQRKETLRLFRHSRCTTRWGMHFSRKQGAWMSPLHAPSNCLSKRKFNCALFEVDT
jgi:hypothetical protein